MSFFFFFFMASAFDMIEYFDEKITLGMYDTESIDYLKKLDELKNI